MSPKRKFLDFRTTLYIIIVVLIVVGAYFLITSGGGDKVFTPDQILKVKAQYIGQTITVEGTYYTSSNSVAKSTSIGDLEPTGLSLDLTKVNDTPVVDQNKYRFTGTLEWASEGDQSVILRVTQIRAV
jgi:hypothetical protein